jgi:type IV pilus assembly protein PilE
MNTLKQVQKGFTLLELMIVIAVIGIIAAIALPNYQNYVRRARATEATSALANMRIRMEQYFQDNRTYVGGPCAAPVGTSARFAYACNPAATATTYTLTATGAGDMAAYTYSVNENNAKTSSFNATCWSLSTSGAC